MIPVASKPYVLVGSTTECHGTLMVTTVGVEPVYCTLCCCSRVVSSVSSYNLRLFCTMKGVVLGCGGNGEGDVKVSGFARDLTTLGGDFSADIASTANS